MTEYYYVDIYDNPLCKIENNGSQFVYFDSVRNWVPTRWDVDSANTKKYYRKITKDEADEYLMLHELRK